MRGRDVLDRDGGWAELAGAGLLGLAVPEAYGGEGLGLPEVSILLRETGRRAKHLPVWETLCCGVLTLAAHGTDEQQRALLPGVASGQVVLTPAVRELAATTYADGTVTGRKIGVTYAADASHLLVTAQRGDETVAALVDVSDPGVTLIEAGSSARITTHTVVFDAATAELLEDGAARTLLDLWTAGLCLTAAGSSPARATSPPSYVKGRSQFGRSLAEFQAVAMQIADVFIASRTLDLAAANAAWRVPRGSPAERRPGRRGVLACTEGSAGAAHLPPPARRHGRRRDLPAAPLLLSWIKDIVRALGGSTARAERGAGRGDRPARTSSSPRSSARSRPRCAPTSPAWSTTRSAARCGPTGTATAYHRVIKQMGADGWMGVGWPTEYGGQGLGEIEQQIFANEAARSDVHLPAVTLQTVGPTLTEVRHREAEGHVPRRHPRRRRALRDRLLRARRRHRPGLAAHDCDDATATTTSSTARRSGPPAATPPTTSGSRCAPTPTRPSTRASRC